MAYSPRTAGDDDCICADPESYIRGIQLCRGFFPTVLLKPTCTATETRVKSGNFGQRVNSDIHLQTVKIQMRQL